VKTPFREVSSTDFYNLLQQNTKLLTYSAKYQPGATDTLCVCVCVCAHMRACAGGCVCGCGVRLGLDWTGLDWTGPDRTGPDWTGEPLPCNRLFVCVCVCVVKTVGVSPHPYLTPLVFLSSGRFWPVLLIIFADRFMLINSTTDGRCGTIFIGVCEGNKS
jgi:hypothetical protein